MADATRHKYSGSKRGREGVATGGAAAAAAAPAPAAAAPPQRARRRTTKRGRTAKPPPPPPPPPPPGAVWAPLAAAVRGAIDGFSKTAGGAVAEALAGGGVFEALETDARDDWFVGAATVAVEACVGAAAAAGVARRPDASAAVAAWQVLALLARAFPSVQRQALGVAPAMLAAAAPPLQRPPPSSSERPAARSTSDADGGEKPAAPQLRQSLFVPHVLVHDALGAALDAASGSDTSAAATSTAAATAAAAAAAAAAAFPPPPPATFNAAALVAARLLASWLSDSAVVGGAPAGVVAASQAATAKLAHLAGAGGSVRPLDAATEYPGWRAVEGLLALRRHSRIVLHSDDAAPLTPAEVAQLGVDLRAASGGDAAGSEPSHPAYAGLFRSADAALGHAAAILRAVDEPWADTYLQPVRMRRSGPAAAAASLADSDDDDDDDGGGAESDSVSSSGSASRGGDGGGDEEEWEAVAAPHVAPEAAALQEAPLPWQLPPGLGGDGGGEGESAATATAAPSTTADVPVLDDEAGDDLRRVAHECGAVLAPLLGSLRNRLRRGDTGAAAAAASSQGASLATRYLPAVGAYLQRVNNIVGKAAQVLRCPPDVFTQPIRKDGRRRQAVSGGGSSQAAPPVLLSPGAAPGAATAAAAASLASELAADNVASQAAFLRRAMAEQSARMAATMDPRLRAFLESTGADFSPPPAPPPRPPMPAARRWGRGGWRGWGRR